MSNAHGQKNATKIYIYIYVLLVKHIFLSNQKGNIYFILFVLTYILMPSVSCVLVSVGSSVVFVIDFIGPSVTTVLADKI